MAKAATKKSGRIILIDSHAIIHRAFHALPTLTSPDGKLVNAVYGFASILLKIVRDLKPDFGIAAFDTAAPTFRHAAYERYKAQRVKAPDTLYEQIPVVQELLSKFGVPVIELDGYEADDIIGTIVTQVRKKYPAMEIIIVTGDHDALQLVDDHVKVFTMRKGIADTIFMGPAEVRERYGLRPAQLIDYKALRGDPSDNIPGVKGIGEKSASELLQKNSSVEKVYAALKKGTLDAKPGVLAALREHEKDAYFSKTLATIQRNVPISFSLEDARIHPSSRDDMRRALESLGFMSLVRRMNGEDGEGKASSAHQKSERETKVESVLSLAALPDKGDRVIYCEGEELFIATAGRVYRVPLDQARASLLSPLGEGTTYVYDWKPLLDVVPEETAPVDLKIVWWLLDSGRRSYDALALARKESGREDDFGPAEIASLLLSRAPGMHARLRANVLDELYETMERPLVPILRRMEERGIGFDASPLKKLSVSMAKEISELQASIYEIAGGPLNVNSPRQLSELLFTKLGLADKGIRKTEKTGSISTRESELAKLKTLHPVIELILRYRELAKLKSTYVDSLPEMAGKDGRIHTTWDQTGTATGRISSLDPNLQNIPTRSEKGREIRKAFIAEKGWRLVAFDYSQLELRIAADLSGDKKMIQAFTDGVDIHKATAAMVNHIDVSKVTPQQRYAAKALNFGILYGMGARAFAESAGIPRGEADAFIEEYFHQFSGIKKFIDETKQFAHDQGYTKTAFGHRRYFPEIGGTNFRMQREAERMAVNHPIQGTEGEIMKRAMIATEVFFEKEGLRDDARLLLQIHDELMFEMKESVIASIGPKIIELMQGVWEGKVTMKVEMKQGKNWGELE